VVVSYQQRRAGEEVVDDGLMNFFTDETELLTEEGHAREHQNMLSSLSPVVSCMRLLASSAQKWNREWTVIAGDTTGGEGDKHRSFSGARTPCRPRSAWLMALKKLTDS
jgi:hypothetical protein